MLQSNLDESSGILYLKPQSALQAEDFLRVTNLIESYAKQHGKLKGIIVETVSFPGWENWAAFSAHFNFIKKYHHQVNKIALVTNSKFALVGKMIGPVFFNVPVKQFPYDQVTAAQAWIEQ